MSHPLADYTGFSDANYAQDYKFLGPPESRIG